jgi:hypothetical protein
MQRHWRISIFGHFISNRSIVCAYNALTMQAIYFDEKRMLLVPDFLNEVMNDMVKDIINLLKLRPKELLSLLITTRSTFWIVWCFT